MESQDTERRLAAILAADVAGYTRLMNVDEDAAMAAWWSARKEVITPSIDEYGGRIVKHTGDGFLAEFSTVLNAVQCAIDMQTEQAIYNADVPPDHRMDFRMGINLGDIIIDSEDIYGDGVNIAARIESLAAPGGISISASVYDQVRKKVDLTFEDMGEQTVKNISDPIHVYAITLEQPAGSVGIADKVSLKLPDKPSIAVLPFVNLSVDPEQDFFADGVAEDIITALSHYRWFFVIARNSSFTYKGRTVNVKQVAQELGVRYVVEGSVRKAENRVRVTAQLIDASTGNNIWAELYDRELDDIFALQDEITETIVTAIEPELGAIERERAQRKPPDNLDAWDSFQRGLWHAFDDVTPAALSKAKRWFKRACELDPNFAVAHAELAYTYVAEIIRGQTDDQEASLEKAYRAAEKAVNLDPRDPVARSAHGRVYIFRRAFDKAVAEMEAAIALNPNSDRANYGLGLALLYGGKPDESIKCFEAAIRLSPRGPLLWAYQNMLGRAYFNMEKYEEALTWFEKSIQQPNTTYMPYIDAAATLGHLGRIKKAGALHARGIKRKPDFSVDTIKRTIGVHGRHSGADRIIDGLNKAGLTIE
jgi:adenylate cyclase